MHLQVVHSLSSICSLNECTNSSRDDYPRFAPSRNAHWKEIDAFFLCWVSRSTLNRSRLVTLLIGNVSQNTTHFFKILEIDLSIKEWDKPSGVIAGVLVSTLRLSVHGISTSKRISQWGNVINWPTRGMHLVRHLISSESYRERLREMSGRLGGIILSESRMRLLSRVILSWLRIGVVVVLNATLQLKNYRELLRDEVQKTFTIGFSRKLINSTCWYACPPLLTSSAALAHVLWVCSARFAQNGAPEAGACKGTIIDDPMDQDLVPG